MSAPADVGGVVESSTSTGSAPSATSRPPHPGRPRPRRWRRTGRWLARSWLGRVLSTALIVLVVSTGWSLGTALTAPGSSTVVARVAEWARGHGFSTVVSMLEQAQYRLAPPKVGGAPNTAILAGDLTGSTTHVLHPQQRASTVATVALHAPLAPLVTPGLPGEGVFKPVETVHGQPAIQVTYLRPDSQHTSYLTGVAWMDQKLIRFVQHPGWSQPGNLSWWNQPDTVPPTARVGLLATFNNGFKLPDAHGGYYQNGRYAAPLVAGAASMVFNANGTINIGSWGSEVTMTPQVTGVRQNLTLLVDHGHVLPSVYHNIELGWGLTIKGAYYVWRSGIGITKNGNLVYATGPALSVADLAMILQRAGAVRAMQLDINPAWVSYMWYQQTSNVAAPIPHKLVNFWEPADRYFHHASRDFVAAYAR